VKRMNKFLLIFLLAVMPSMAFAAGTGERIRNFLSFSPDNFFFPILLVMGLLLIIGAFLYPRFGLLVMMFFMLVSTDIQLDNSMRRAPSIRFEDIILLIVSFGWLLNRARNRSLALFKSVPVNKPVLFMACIIVISTIVGFISDSTPMKRGVLFSLKRLEYFWIYFMTLNIMDSNKEVKIAIKILLILTSLIAVVGAIQFFFYPMSGLTGGGATATSGFGRANTLADYYLIAGGVFTGLLIYSKKRNMTIVYLIVCVLCSAAIIMTKSRGAYVSIPPLIITLFLLTRSRKFLMSLIVIFSLFIIYSLTMIFISASSSQYDNARILVQKHTGDIENQFESIRDIATKGVESDSSFYARYSSWVNNIDKILQRPFIGHGVGSVPLSFFDCHHVREIYETGFIGYGIFLWMNLIIFLSILKLFQVATDSFSKGISAGFLGGHVAMLVHGWSIANFYTIMNMEVFWFLIALLMILYYNLNMKLLNMESRSLIDRENL